MQFGLKKYIYFSLLQMKVNLVMVHSEFVVLGRTSKWNISREGRITLEGD